MSKLKSKEIDYILDTYKKLKSIEKTAKETGFSKITVNKYVRDISSTDKRSRYCKNKISQIDVNTNEIIKEWNKPSIAAKELNINPAEICRVLKGELKQAGGYSWRYR
ncbi:hypothetical protein [Clostridium sporogenes]|uniref:hypothetical protein n=1 Tax=Clostridium sporogenes TaxID=1509 RepID=UPI0013D5B5CE|nr:hypothetical protein [Clostridium sporogenes]NFH40744.1 hypothetical protein [Clostridium sporogenes]